MNERTLNDTSMSFSHFNSTLSDFRWRQLLVDFPSILAVRTILLRSASVQLSSPRAVGGC